MLTVLEFFRHFFFTCLISRVLEPFWMHLFARECYFATMNYFESGSVYGAG